MATNKVVVAGSDVTASQLKDFFRQIEDGSIKHHHLQAFLDHRNPFPTEVRESKSAPVALPDIDWKATYKELGITGPAALIKREDEFWYMPVTEEVTCELVVKTLRRLGITCDLYTEKLDKDVKENDRQPKSGAYTVKVRRRIEADEEFKSLSANDLKERGHSGITLLEQLLLFLGYYVTTKQYLDVDNWTLCAGSRYSDGSVPSVDWYPDYRKLCVHWTSRDHRRDYLRSREAVLL